MKYEITFTRYGFVEIEANSESEAFDATDIQSEEEEDF